MRSMVQSFYKTGIDRKRDCLIDFLCEKLVSFFTFKSRLVKVL